MDLATIQIKVDTRQVKAANEDIQKLGKTGQMTSKKVTAANDDMAKSAKSTTSAFKLLGGAMAALGVGALVTSFTRTVTESERLKGSLKTMTGSTEDAAFAFSELEKFASQTPFTLDQSVEGFIKLKALGLDPSERALRSYGNTSAAMGKDMMQMIEAVADASTGEFERLKEFGIKASKEGDRVSLTFQGMTTTIGNSSEEIQEYLLGIGETKFGSAMEDQMKALPGLLSNLSDNVSALFRKIGDVGGINLFATAISGASALIVGITNNLDILTTGVGAALAGFVAFTIGSNATRILGGFTAMRVRSSGSEYRDQGEPDRIHRCGYRYGCGRYYRELGQHKSRGRKGWGKYPDRIRESEDLSHGVIRRRSGLDYRNVHQRAEYRHRDNGGGRGGGEEPDRCDRYV
jgi:hypothetical protein